MKNTDRLQIDIHMQAGCFVVIPCTKYPNIGHSEIVKRLLRKGAKVAFKDTTGQTAVHYACSAGSSECLKLLWSAGANVDVKDSNGETALYKAAIKGHLDVLRLLIEKGEKGSSTSSEGSSSPLSFTPQRALLRNWETVTLLLSHDHASNDGDLGDAIDSVEQLHYQQEGNNLSISTSGNSGRKNSLSLSNSSLNGGEEGGSDIIAQQQHLTLSEKPKKRTMDVLIIITKHGEQHSAFQLVSIDGCVQGFNLFLEGNNEDAGLAWRNIRESFASSAAAREFKAVDEER
ncbi:Transient receptor potential channel pyrexia [Balamuthia mandrillaris]